MKRLGRMAWCVATMTLSLAAAFAQVGSTTLASVSANGAPGNGASMAPSMTSDGRFMAFVSIAGLVPGKLAGFSDVFVRDRVLGTTDQVSISASGDPANNSSDWACISADGRYVVFESIADNLVQGDTNECWDVFVRDRLLGTTGLVSVSSGGAQGNSDSGFQGLAISADGRFVAFGSLATNLVPGDNNRNCDVFVRDRVLGTTELASVSSSGSQGNWESGWFDEGPAMSADGRYVVFGSSASNLVPGDTNGVADVCVRDRVLGITSRISVTTDGSQATRASWWPAVSADGRFIAFYSPAPELTPNGIPRKWQILVHDQAAGTTDVASLTGDGQPGDSDSDQPTISADGRFVAFASYSDNLVPGDTNLYRDIFVRDRLLGTTQRVSVATGGTQGNGDSETPYACGNGAFVGFGSWASTLVAEDDNGASDVFTHQIGPSGGWPVVTGVLAPDVGVLPHLTRFDFRSVGQLQPFATWLAAIAPGGSFSLPAPVGTFDLSVKVSHWLRRTIHSVSTATGSIDVGTLALTNGDASGDNHVGVADLSVVLADFGTTSEVADLDGNGTVGLGDISIVLASYGASGDQ